jgi:transposase-like protein
MVDIDKAHKITEIKEQPMCPECFSDYKIQQIGKSEYMCPSCLASFTVNINAHKG